MKRYYRKKHQLGIKAKKTNFPINEEIEAKEVRLIDHEKNNVGIIPISKALEMASAINLDLVCVSQKNKIPICKILDYSKFKFEMQKKEKMQRKNQTKIIRKEYRIGVLTTDYDINYRKKQIIEAIQKGYHVKVSLKLHGRFLGMEKAGYDVLEKLVLDLKDYVEVDKPPERSSKRYVDLYIVPNKTVLEKLKKMQRQKKEMKNQVRKNLSETIDKLQENGNNKNNHVKIKNETILDAHNENLDANSE